MDRKKITAAFDGGRITSDAGVVLLGQAEPRRGLADKLAAVIADPRNPLLITHPIGSILRTRILAIACGYEDGTISIICGTPPSGSLAALARYGGGDLCTCAGSAVASAHTGPQPRSLYGATAIMAAAR